MLMNVLINLKIGQFLPFSRFEWNSSLNPAPIHPTEHFEDCRYFDCCIRPISDSANTIPTESKEKKWNDLMFKL